MDILPTTPATRKFVLGSVIGMILISFAIYFAVTRYALPDTRYQMAGDYQSESDMINDLLKGYAKTSDLAGYQTKGSYLTQDALKNYVTGDMLSQQMNKNLVIASAFFRSIGFIQISPNTVLVSPATSGLTTGYGGLPSCISSNSPLFVLSGSPAFVNKLMAIKDTDPNATVLKALLSVVKSVGTESFRWRRRQTAVPSATGGTAAPLSPYQQQLKTNLYDRLPLPADLNDTTKVTAADKTLLENFAKKYCFIINDFNADGLPILRNLSALTPSTGSSNFTDIPKDTTIYRTIVSDIYRFYPSILNKCA